MMPTNSVVASEDIPTCFWCGRDFRSMSGLESHLRKEMNHMAVTCSESRTGTPESREQGSGGLGQPDEDSNG